MRALTGRERQVMRLVVNGNTNAGIGRILGLHPRTVDRHLANIYQALGARDRANAAALALLLGEIGPGDVQLPNQQQEAA
ncbi:helix-turn-helix domain-containing protein [Streptomyces sp. NPDC002092]